MKKIIFFNIADVFEPNVHPTLGLGYIKSYILKKHKQNIQVKIFRNDIFFNILKEKPDLIGISSVTQFYTQAVEFSTKLKSILKNTLIVIGGVHISTLPKSFNEIFDCGIICEGEITFSEIVSLIIKNEFKKEKLMEIDGLVFTNNNQLIITKNRQLIQNLDDIPHVDRNDYNHKNFVHIITSRGCPYACAFCSSTHFWGTRAVRYHSAQYVYEEIKSLVENYSIKHISIWDDLFAFNIPRLKEIINLLKKDSNIYGKVTFGCTARANIVNDLLCELLKELNVKYVSLGLESGSNKILNKIKGAVSLEDNKRAVDILHRWGFIVKGSFVINNPDEEIEDLELTYRFIKESQLDGGVVNVAIPFPATEYWEYAVNDGIVCEDMDFGLLKIKTDFRMLKENDLIKLSKNMTKKEIIEWGIKIQKELHKKELSSLKKMISFGNIIIGLKNPTFALKYILYIIFNFQK